MVQTCTSTRSMHVSWCLYKSALQRMDCRACRLLLHDGRRGCEGGTCSTRVLGLRVVVGSDAYRTCCAMGAAQHEQRRVVNCKGAKRRARAVCQRLHVTLESRPVELSVHAMHAVDVRGVRSTRLSSGACVFRVVWLVTCDGRGVRTLAAHHVVRWRSIVRRPECARPGVAMPRCELV